MDRKIKTKQNRWNFRGREALEAFLLDNGILKEECCIVGGLIFNAYGLREHNDLDIIVNSKNAEKLKRKYPIKNKNFEQIDIDIPGEDLDVKLTIFEPFGFTNDELIYSEKYHFLYDGFKVLRLEIAFSKRLLDLSISSKNQRAREDFSIVSNYIKHKIGGVRVCSLT